jgi:hypothetical protein
MIRPDRQRRVGVLPRFRKAAQSELGVREMGKRVRIARVQPDSFCQLNRRLIEAAEKKQVQAVLLPRRGIPRCERSATFEEAIGNLRRA